MSSSYNSDRRIEHKSIKTRGMHLQPLTKSQREERLSKSQGDLGEIPRWLNDAWKAHEIKDFRTVDRGGMIEQVVSRLVWFDDLNHRSWIKQKIIGSELFANWEGSRDDVDQLIDSVDSKRPENKHYSVYLTDFHNDKVVVKWPDGSKAKLTKSERSHDASDGPKNDNDSDEKSVGQSHRNKQNPFRMDFEGKYNDNLNGSM